MSDNAPENVMSFTDEEMTSAILHNLTHMIKNQAKDAAAEVMPIALGASLGMQFSQKEMGKALAYLMEKLTISMDMALLIEELLPAQFDKTGERAKAMGVEVNQHPMILKAAMRYAESSADKLNRVMRDGR